VETGVEHDVEVSLGGVLSSTPGRTLIVRHRLVRPIAAFITPPRPPQSSAPARAISSPVARSGGRSSQAGADHRDLERKEHARMPS
jgi:hypothetical protein